MPLKLFPESAVQAESSDLFLDFIRVHQNNMQKSFGNLLLILQLILIFIELFFAEQQNIDDAGTQVYHLYGCLLFLTCLLGFSLINNENKEVAWLRVLASMMCCALVYQFTPIWNQFVQLAMGRSQRFVLIRNGRIFAHCMLVSMHVLLALAYLPCFDPSSTARKYRTQSLGFLTKPLMITLPATLAWAGNKLCIQLISYDVQRPTYLLEAQSNMFQLMQCGAFVATLAWIIRFKQQGRRNVEKGYEIGVLNLIGGVMALGYFILYAGVHNNDLYTFNTVMCILTEILWIALFGPVRRLLLKIPTTPSHIFESLIAAGVASMAGLNMSAGSAMILGFALALTITLFQFLTTKCGKNFQSTGILILTGAIFGLFTGDINRFRMPQTYFLSFFSTVFGALFGIITGFFINKFNDYSLEDFGKLQ